MLDDTPPIFISSGPWSSPRGLDPSLVQGVVSKSITWEPRDGNPGDTVAALAPNAHLNWQGLPNPGCAKFCEKALPDWIESGHRLIVSIAGETKDDYLRCAEKLLSCGVTAIELNLSCPNAAGVDADVLAEIPPALSSSARIYVKVAPNPYDISTTADQITAVASHLSGVVSGNSIPAALIHNGSVQLGGMTGAWLKPVALRTAHEISTRITVPVIGCGGVESAQDVRDYLAAGCVAVQVGSANLRGPDAILDIVTDLIQ